MSECEDRVCVCWGRDLCVLHLCCYPMQGLGNAFLSNINACDALFHVVRKLLIS